MPNLPSVRQRSRAANPGPGTREIAQQNLTRAFMTFTQAAGSLENSYTQLQAEVARLHQELQRANLQLDRSLEENARIRKYLSRVLESCPAGYWWQEMTARPRSLTPKRGGCCKYRRNGRLESMPGCRKLREATRRCAEEQFFFRARSTSAGDGRQPFYRHFARERERELTGRFRTERHNLDRARHYGTKTAGGRAGNGAAFARAGGSGHGTGARNSQSVGEHGAFYRAACRCHRAFAGNAAVGDPLAGRAARAFGHGEQCPAFSRTAAKRKCCRPISTGWSAKRWIFFCRWRGNAASKLLCATTLAKFPRTPTPTV